jgi:transposase InsO family protein
MTRLSNGLGKRWENLRAALALGFDHYNFCRIHQTIRVTSAMEARITDHFWDLAELPT